MKRVAITAAAVALGAVAAIAQDCKTGSPDIFEFRGAQAERKAGATVGRLDFVNRTDKIIRMAHVTAIIRDKLGVDVGTLDFPVDDVQIPRVPGAYFFRVPGLERLATLKPDFVDGTVCTTSVLYDDGSNVDFE